ncbi:MAG: transposase family protein [Candidatus Thermoplasmatota archaeon]
MKKEVAETQGMWFRTKIQIAVDLLRRSLTKVNPLAVVFDEWYMCHELLEFLNSHGLTWVSQAKSNRLIQVDDVWVGLAKYAKTVHHQMFQMIDAEVEEKRYKWFCETLVMMKNVGLVKLVVLKRRKNYYSGKKKKHTVKTQIMVNKKGLILHKTKHKNGKKHDYDLFKKTGPPPLPPKVELGVDLSYYGIETDYPLLNVNIPFKKPKKKELTKQEKQYNKKQRKARVIVEHTISRMKKFRIMAEEFRNRLTRYDRMTSIVCGLVNFTTQSE